MGTGRPGDGALGGSRDGRSAFGAYAAHIGCEVVAAGRAGGQVGVGAQMAYGAGRPEHRQREAHKSGEPVRDDDIPVMPSSEISRTVVSLQRQAADGPDGGRVYAPL